MGGEKFKNIAKNPGKAEYKTECTWYRLGETWKIRKNVYRHQRSRRRTNGLWVANVFLLFPLNGNVIGHIEKFSYRQYMEGTNAVCFIRREFVIVCIRLETADEEGISLETAQRHRGNQVEGGKYR